MEIILYTLLSLSGLGIILALILYVVAQRFKVVEDPRIDEIDELLPGANCGGCGYPGCRGFAEALVQADSLDDFYCPVGGNETMKAAASILGKEVAEKEKQVAVVRCQGSPEHRKKTSEYDGPQSCILESKTYSGDSDCPYACLGLGDCVEACDFDAIHMNPETHLPEVIEANCTACNACVEVCPHDIIELRNAGKKSRRIYVSCVNEDKGGPAKKACDVACIGCGKCVKVCAFDAITLENNLAYIDYEKCKLCRKCVDECPTNAIVEVNFPPKKKKTEKKPPPDKKETEKKSQPKDNTNQASENEQEQQNSNSDETKA
ncbi:MAG: Fe-S cluster domain-containing protein [Candidatus Delongbacteria bacterium]|nr:Fe-S cluster domain-containing protein [Candidatus Delongbacteria bacterium]